MNLRYLGSEGDDFRRWHYCRIGPFGGGSVRGALNIGSSATLAHLTLKFRTWNNSDEKIEARSEVVPALNSVKEVPLGSFHRLDCGDAVLAY